MQVFTSGVEQDLSTILANKDWRARFQLDLMEQFPQATILAIKLNIPGSIKNNQSIERIFSGGWFRLLENFDEVTIQEELFLHRKTGPEGFIVIREDLRNAKIASVDFEQAWSLGRLFDVDVMSKQNISGGQLSRTSLGLPVRQCFVCGAPAKECARLQTHTKTEISKAIDDMVTTYFGE